MPMLLEDLAEETSASNRRVADRLDAEARDLDVVRRAEVALEELRAQALESARQASDYAAARVPQAEGVWRLALVALREHPASADAERLLASLLNVFESGRQLVHSSRALWRIVELSATTPEPVDELDRAEARFAELTAEATLALEHRTRDWQPADPERLARGLQLAREGKTVKAVEARNWFRRTQS